MCQPGRPGVSMPPGAGQDWYTALMPYIIHFGPSSGRNVSTAIRHRGFVTAINPSPEILAQLQADEDIRLDLLEVDSPEALSEVMQRRIETGRRVK